MFKRIKKIKRTGVFREANGNGLGALEFDKFTVIYGLNAYGKSTLKDVFCSISENDPKVLRERLSIPHDEHSSQQEVCMSFMRNGNEESLEFVNGAWNTNALKGKILVFDDEFTHKNLFTGTAIARNNNEALTDFILGEEGVSHSEKIRGLKESLNDIKKKLNEQKPLYFEKIADDVGRKTFLIMEVKETKDDLKKLKCQKNEMLNNLSNIEEIKKLNVLTVPQLTIENDLQNIVDSINKELRRDYKEVTNEIMNKLKTHLTNHVKGKNDQGWIVEGLTKYKKGDDCPFCGQSTEAVSDLMDAYNGYFNDDYKRFSNEITSNMQNTKSQLTKISPSIYSAFQNLIIEIGKYKNYSSNIDDEVDLNGLKEDESSVKTALENNKEVIMKQIDKKIKMPHEAFSDSKLSESFEEVLDKFKENINSLAEKITPTIRKATELKNSHSSLTEEDLNQKKMDLQSEIHDIEEKLARLEQDAQCSQYIIYSSKKNTLANEIENESNDLESQQSEYINKYFGDLNQVYKKLGSHNFKLKVIPSNRGNKKIYSLNIDYKGKKVSLNDVSKVLSESDRRSLSFAIFLSKLKHLEKPEEYIIVLDDPVVSFDNNRISNTIQIIKEHIATFKQLIVLTHHPLFVTKLLRSKCDGAYFELNKNEHTNSLETLRRDKFTLSEHDLAFNKIDDYIQGKHMLDISMDCRIFMEKHLQMKYCKHLRDRRIEPTSLDELINNLKENELIDNEQYQLLNDFREQLNSSHHNFTSSENAENNKNYANSLLGTLFKL